MKIEYEIRLLCRISTKLDTLSTGFLFNSSHRSDVPFRAPTTTITKQNYPLRQYYAKRIEQHNGESFTYTRHVYDTNNDEWTRQKNPPTSQVTQLSIFSIIQTFAQIRPDIEFIRNVPVRTTWLDVWNASCVAFIGAQKVSAKK